MSFQVDVVHGSEDERDFNRHHLLTAVASRRVMSKVLEKSSSILDETVRDRLGQLWSENFASSGGLPQLQQQQRCFDINQSRSSKILSQVLPAQQLRSNLLRPAVVMVKPPALHKRTTFINTAPLQISETYFPKELVRRKYDSRLAALRTIPSIDRFPPFLSQFNEGVSYWR
jgi:hypothetical protein